MKIIKFSVLLSLLLIGCAHTPKYKSGDCANMVSFHLTHDNKFDYMGYMLADFKVIGTITLYNKLYYKVNFIDNTIGAFNPEPYLIPVEELDKFPFVYNWWDSTYTNFHCNRNE